MQIVPDGRICSFFDEQLHHRQMSILRRHVERGNALTVGEAAEGGFPVDGRAVIQQPCGSF